MAVLKLWEAWSSSLTIFYFAAGYLHNVQFRKVERNTDMPKSDRVLKCWDGRYEKIVRERL
jgi:hypothetical protein